MIGVSLVLDTLTTDENHMWQAIYANTNPAEPKPSWGRLGYDVSDLYLLSGLTNCGYEPDEQNVLQGEMKRYLNQYHLFTDLNPALEFKEISDHRVPEHAPFFVYGLYVIAVSIFEDDSD